MQDFGTMLSEHLVAVRLQQMSANAWRQRSVTCMHLLQHLQAQTNLRAWAHAFLRQQKGSRQFCCLHASTPQAAERAKVQVRSDVPADMLSDEVNLARLHALRCHFCKRCGAPMELALPPDEHQLRHVCQNCSFVDYHNPKMVVGCLVEHKGQVLLCKRALEPCSGLWTLPAGYMELGESCAGAFTTLSSALPQLA
jgi:NADH pyrophosphatase NudC (nudix superfamily)